MTTPSTIRADIPAGLDQRVSLSSINCALLLPVRSGLSGSGAMIHRLFWYSRTVNDRGNPTAYSMTGNHLIIG